MYRRIIDEVVANVGVDFEEYGMDEAVLTLLQAVSHGCQAEAKRQKWEAKLLQSKVADFARAPGASDDEDDDDDDAPHAGSSSAEATPSQAGHNPYGYTNAPNYTQQYSTAGQFNGTLAMPGMAVKTEPDVVIRPRGGAVSARIVTLEAQTNQTSLKETNSSLFPMSSPNPMPLV